MSDPLSLEDVVVRTAERYQKYTRSPYGLKEALQKAQQADEGSMDQIALSHSELVWKAFYAASKSVRPEAEGFNGKAEFARSLDYLRDQPLDYQEKYFQLLASRMASSGAGAPTHSVKRTYTNAEGDSDANEVTSQAKRSRITAGDGTAVPVQQSKTTQSAETLPNAVDPYVSQQIAAQHVSEGDIFFGASLKPAKELFSPEFWNSVKRIPDKEKPDVLLADMSIIFHEDVNRHIFGCQMEIGIVKEDMADIAFKLYGIRLKSTDGVISAPQAGGGRIEPHTAFVLRGSMRKFSSLFKGNLLEGVRSSPMYKREEDEARDTTDAVSMRIPSRAENDATIIMHLGEWRATKLREALYP